MPTIYRAAFVALSSLALTITVACSSDDTTPGPDGGKQVCPTTVPDAVNASTTCQTEGYVCVVGFPCGNFIQQATCTCATGAWACKLAGGKAVDPGTTDTNSLCQSTGDGGTDPCPSSPGAIADAGSTPVTCTNSGQVCDYVGVKCAGDLVARTDTCQCKGNVFGDAGLSWQCDISTCP